MVRAYAQGIIFLIFLFLTMGREALCQKQSIEHNLIQFSTKEGLASSDVSALFQDSRNYLWIAHAVGVSRYDGYHFDNYLFSGDTRLGRSYCIEEDDAYHHWIGADAGLFLFFQNKLTAIRFTDKPLPVYALKKDGKGGIWVCTSDGPAYFSAAYIKKILTSNEIEFGKKILPDWKKMFPITNTTVNITINEAGIIYVTDGYVIYKIENRHLTVVWRSTVRADAVTGLCSLKKDSLFFSTIFTGFHCLENGEHTTVTNTFGNGNALLERNGQIFYYATTGIYRFDKKLKQLIAVVILPEKIWEWGSCALQDNENNFWIGTHEKLAHAREKLFSNLVQPKTEDLEQVYSIKQLKNGDMVCGVARGKIYKRTFGKPDFEFQQHVFKSAALHDILEDEKGNIWLASAFQGIGLCTNGKTTIYTKKEGLRDNSNFFFLYTQTKELFTGGDDGISKIIKDDSGKINFKNYKHYTGSNHYAVFRTGIQKPDGGLLFGSDLGLYELINDSLKAVLIQNLSRKNLYVTDIKVDEHDNIWISTMGDGILICEVEKNGSLKLLKQLSEADGLTSMLYLKMLIDKNKIVWAANYSGISRIEFTNQSDFFISNFDKTHGYIDDNYHSVKLTQDNTGIIWIATSSGLFHFDPFNALRNISIPPVELKNVLNEHTKTGLQRYASATDSANGLAVNSKLPYNVNALYFEFSSIHLADPSLVRYMYRLKGLDSNWVNAGNNRSATFRNLAPGQYIFEVKASAGTNRWSNTASYSFSIQPPFWNTWWFYALSLLLLGSLVYGLIIKREKTIKEKEKQKTELQKLKASSYQHQLEIEQVINYFATSMNEQKTIDEMLWDVARNCISKLGFEDCVIYLKDDRRNVFVQKAAVGPKSDDSNTILHPLEIPIGKGIVGSVALTGQPEIISDTSLDERYIVDDARRFSEITVPITDGGKVIGVIDSEHHQKDFYTARHLQILTTIASLCADKIIVAQTEQARQQAQLEALENKQKATVAKLQSMRLQMNPHFLFNALNSIQQMILTGDEIVATRYLSKFSRLLRMVLIHSDRESVTLRNELETLQLYIELESVRFKDKFEFNISCDEEIDQDETMIPTLLIQPFVENAIWHGLMHKEGKRKLHVHFKEDDTGNLLCIIEDNGIGRAAAKEAKENSTAENKHTGKGILVTQDRLRIFSEQYNMESNVEILDLKNANNEAAGTKVIVKLPSLN